MTADPRRRPAVRADAEWMARAVALGRTGPGRTAPNPWVGAVVVPARQRGVRAFRRPVWFDGATAPPGGPHAEVAALSAAGAQARGGTLYVTLEPCAHHGRTPPCTEAILAAGVRAGGGGHARSRPPGRRGGASPRSATAGLDVEVGVGAPTRSPSSWPRTCKHRRTGRPWVVLKLAATLDGRIAAPDGSSRWITGEAARADAHRLRAVSDAVLVGAGTVRADDPALTVRLPETRGSGAPTTSRCGSCSGSFPPVPRCAPPSSCGARRARCSTSWVAGGCCRCWWRGAPRWPTPSTAPGWWTATCSIWPRPCSGATTPGPCSPVRGRPPSTGCGGGGWCR